MENTNETILGGEAKTNSRFSAERSAFVDKYRIFHTLDMAHSAIVDLRAQVERLTPRAEAYDVIARMWQGRGDAGGYATVDPLWEIRELTERMEREFRAEKQAAYEAGDAREVFDADHDEETRPERPIDRMARGNAAVDLSDRGFAPAEHSQAIEPEPGT